jgi:Xaa-Pro aminopeptidase
MKFDKIIFENRREKLRSLMKQYKIPALLINSSANRFYLSGFELHDPQCNETAGWIIVTESGDDYLLTDPRYDDAAKRVWDDDKIFIYSGRKFEALKKFFHYNKITSLFIDYNDVSVFEHEKLKELCELKSAPALVEQLRMVKDASEIECMKKACALNHKVYEQIQPSLIPGKTELEISWEIEQLFRNGGASELAFTTIVGIDQNAALPHAIPGETTLKEGSHVLIDMGCRVDDYCSDQTRTFWVGDKPSDRFLEVRQQVMDAQTAAIKTLRPGLPISQAYRTAYTHFEKLGVEKYFTHSLGHGIGLETHESPSVSPSARGELKPGMVVTMEPGLYYSDWGGVRWEYMALITEDGYEIL